MKSWKRSKPVVIQITNTIKNDLSKLANELIDKKLKPKYIKPDPHAVNINQLIDVTIKWWGSSLYFCAKYKCHSEYAISPSFESRFARLVYTGGNRSDLSYMRYNEQWFNLHSGLTGQECCDSIENESYFGVYFS